MSGRAGNVRAVVTQNDLDYAIRALRYGGRVGTGYAMNEHALIEGTLADLKEAMDALVAERERIDRLIREKADRIREWEARLRAMTTRGEQPTRQRLPKGEPVRRIREYLQHHPDATIKEISNEIGVGWSSVRTALEHNKLDFVVADGRWRLRTRDEAA